MTLELRSWFLVMAGIIDYAKRDQSEIIILLQDLRRSH